MSSSLDLGRFLVLPGRLLVGMIIRVNLKSDVIAKILANLERYNIKVRHIFVSSIEEVERTRMMVFLDVTDSKIPFEDFVKEHERLGLIEVEKVIRSPIEGFIADSASNILTMAGIRSIIFRRPGYKELLVGLREWFGRSGEAFLYEIGYHTGLGFGKRHREVAERLGVKDPAQIYKCISIAMFQWAGYGTIEVKELTHEGGTIVVHDSFECELGRGRVVPYSQFVRGMHAGVLTELFGKRFNVVEEECIAKGDPACRFVAKALPQAHHK